VLAALLGQTYSDFEVIVALDGAVDESLAVLSRIQKPATLLIQDHPNQSRSITRNRGAKAASGELLIFFDDDMRPTPDCVAMHVKHHERHKHSVSGGAQLEEAAVMQSDFQHYKAHLSRKWTQPLADYAGPLPQNQLFLTAANFSIPADLFWQLGGFDEQLTDAEDFDLAVRASRQGIPVFFNAQALAWHDDFITCHSYLRRLKQYQEAHRHLLRMKPDLYGQVLSVRPYKPGFFKEIVYRVLARNYWATLIDRDLPVIKCIPVKIRYKLYDIVTTGLVWNF